MGKIVEKDADGLRRIRNGHKKLRRSKDASA